MEKKNRSLSSGNLENKKDHERFNHRKKTTSSGSNVFPSSGSMQNRSRNRRNNCNENFQVNTSHDEIGSVLSQRSKKANMNHLLNFTYKSINQGNGHPYVRQSEHSAGVIRRRSKLSKEMYLQATCQFILRDIYASHEYTKYADSLVAWQQIEQVRVFNNEPTMCPICLSEPVAGKITRCGHIYCFSCMLHLIAVVDKCAICDDRVKVKDIKSVVTTTRPYVSINDVITLSLMKRLRTSVVSLPVKQWNYQYSSHLTTIDDDDIERNFCKYLLISKLQVQSEIIDKEITELEAQLISCENSEEMYIKEAMNLLLKRKADEEIENVTKDHKQNVSECADETSNGEYFFYQASNGEHLYLHSLNTRCLRKAFGSLEQSPLDIQAKVVEVESYTMTEELRRRFRFLSSLPLMCEFKIIELELNTNLIPAEILFQFSSDIKNRQKQRNKRNKEENKRCNRIRIEENKILGKYPEMKLSINNIEEFPEPSELSPKANDSEHSSSYENKSSFSQMLRNGQSSFSSTDYRVTSRCLASDGDINVPSYKSTFSLDIQQALDNYENEQETTNKSTSGKKKKVPTATLR